MKDFVAGRPVLAGSVATALLLGVVGFLLAGPQAQPPAAVQTRPGEPPKSPTPEQVPQGALVPGGPAPALTVFATGDVVGYIDPCG